MCLPVALLWFVVVISQRSGKCSRFDTKLLREKLCRAAAPKIARVNVTSWQEIMSCSWLGRCHTAESPEIYSSIFNMGDSQGELFPFPSPLPAMEATPFADLPTDIVIPLTKALTNLFVRKPISEIPLEYDHDFKQCFSYKIYFWFLINKICNYSAFLTAWITATGRRRGINTL